jgi:hypothetical protein
VSFTTCEVSGARREGTALGATAPAGEGVHTREGQPHHAIHAVDATQAWVDGGGLTTPPPRHSSDPSRTPPPDPPPSPYTYHIPTFPYIPTCRIQRPRHVHTQHSPSLT